MAPSWPFTRLSCCSGIAVAVTTHRLNDALDVVQNDQALRLGLDEQQALQHRPGMEAESAHAAAVQRPGV